MKINYISFIINIMFKQNDKIDINKVVIIYLDNQILEDIIFDELEDYFNNIEGFIKIKEIVRLEEDNKFKIYYYNNIKGQEIILDNDLILFEENIIFDNVLKEILVENNIDSYSIEFPLTYYKLTALLNELQINKTVEEIINNQSNNSLNNNLNKKIIINSKNNQKKTIEFDIVGDKSVKIKKEKMSINQRKNISKEELNKLITFNPKTDKETSDLFKIAGVYSKDELFLPIIEPSIYAFISEEFQKHNPNIPVTVKVGYTASSRLDRLNFWRKKYNKIKDVGNLVAFFEVDTPNGKERIYFKDHAIHDWLTENGYEFLKHKHKSKLTSGLDFINPFKEDISDEFLLSLNKEPIDQKTLIKAKEGVKSDYIKGNNKYKTYSSIKKNKSKKDHYYDDDPDIFLPYDYQKNAALELAKKLLNNQLDERSKVMLDSQTRSGKSYILFWTLKMVMIMQNNPSLDDDEIIKLACLPNSINNNENNLIVVTTAIPDVFDEFQKSVEKHIHFKNSFKWLNKKELIDNPDLIEEEWAKGNKNIVIALSLQDLAGRVNTEDNKNLNNKDKTKDNLNKELNNDLNKKSNKETNKETNKELKEIHKIIKDKSTFVIADEAHYAMFGRGDSYKAALQENISKSKFDDEFDDDLDKVEAELEGGKAAFELNPKYGFIFSTATTYAIRAENIFDDDSEIVHVPPFEIQSEINKAKEKYQENIQNSPYFGTPEKNFFGIDTGSDISEIFEAKGDKFMNPNNASVILEALFGISQYKEVPALLSNETLKMAGIGRHILMQLPSKNSCDATEKLLIKLGLDKEYKIFNISSKKSGKKIKASEIKESIYSQRFNKTITLTVRRLTTGVSIPAWDTLLLLNSSESLINRIQAYGRVTTPWIESYIGHNDNGDEQEYKYCPKPNAFIIDFHPAHLYEISNQNEIYARSYSNQELEDAGKRIPITGNVFQYNTKELKFNSMTALDIHKQLDEYTSNSPINKLVKKIDTFGSIDIDGLEDFVDINIKANKVIVSPLKNEDLLAKRQLKLEIDDNEIDNNENTESVDEVNDNNEIDDIKAVKEDLDNEKLTKEQLEKRQQAIRQHIFEKVLLATALSDNKIENIDDLLKLIKEDEDFIDITNNIGLVKEFIPILEKISKDAGVKDNLSRSMNAIVNRSSESPNEFINTIVGLNALSANEFLTPDEISDIIIDALNFDYEKVLELSTNESPDILDPACKTGSLVYKTYNRIEQILQEAVNNNDISELDKEETLNNISKQICVIPTSHVSNEILKKLYKKLELPSDNILYCNSLPIEIKENWAHNLAKLTPDLAKIKTKNHDLLKLSIEEIVKTNNQYDILNKSQKEDFIDFLIEYKKLMNEKFDYVISNPPYQINKNEQMQPVYHDFMDTGKLIAKESVMIHPSRFLNNSGKTKNDWSNKILNDNQFKVLKHYHNSKDVFPTVDIKGGIAITSFNQERTDGGYKDGYISIPELKAIKDKVWNNNADDGMDKYIQSAGLFKFADKKVIETNWLKTYSGLFYDNYNYNNYNNYKIIGINKNKRVIKYIKSDNVLENLYIDCYKVFVPRSNGSGALGETLSTPIIGTPIIGTPMMISTASFLTIGQFNTQNEAQNLLRYIKSKFARCTLGLLKNTQHNTRSTWKYVPWQDFTENSDIDWSKSISDIDKQLYKKYNLNEEEINFIETNIKEMN